MTEAMPESSLLGELEVEIEIKAPAAKFFKMCAGTPHHVVKASPDNFQACELHDGEWGTVGSIIFTNYVHDGQAKVLKERVEVVDPENKVVKYRVLEGDLLEGFNSFVITVQVTPKQEGNGSIVRWHFEYEMIDEKVSHPESLIPFFADVAREMDEHLMSEE